MNACEAITKSKQRFSRSTIGPIATSDQLPFVVFALPPQLAGSWEGGVARGGGRSASKAAEIRAERGGPGWSNVRVIVPGRVTE